jgi:UDP-glucose 4-epimerase
MGEPLAVLLTGGAGYIGSATALGITDQLNTEVVIVDDLSTGVADRIPTAASFYNINYGETDRLTHIINQHPFIDTVVHLASSISVSESWSIPDQYIENNVTNFKRMLSVIERHKSIRRIIFSSTVAVYGDQKPITMDESFSEDPCSPYASSKYSGERISKEFAKLHGIELIILRYANVVGSHQALKGQTDPSLTRGVLGGLAEAGRSRNTFYIYGTDWPTPDGTALRDFVHVDDVVDANLRAIAMRSGKVPKQQVMNIGTGVATSIGQIVKYAQDLHPLDVTTRPRQPGDIRGFNVNSSVAEKILDWRPRKSLREILEDYMK